MHESRSMDCILPFAFYTYHIDNVIKWSAVDVVLEQCTLNSNRVVIKHWMVHQEISQLSPISVRHSHSVLIDLDRVIDSGFHSISQGDFISHINYAFIIYMLVRPI